MWEKHREIERRAEESTMTSRNRKSYSRESVDECRNAITVDIKFPFAHEYIGGRYYNAYPGGEIFRRYS